MTKIIKSTFCFFFTIVIINSVYCQPGFSTLTQKVKEVENAIFIIYTFDKKNNPISQGSGFFINSSGIGVTNFHVLSGCSTAFVKTKKGEQFYIETVVDFDNKSDLVKFKINNAKGKILPALNVSIALPKIGESIFNIGNPLGLEQTVSSGIVSSIREISPYGNLIQITAPISEGSSGSPVLNLKGEVIGIATMGYARGQNLNFAVSALKLRELNKSISCPLGDLNKNPLETDNYKKALEEYFTGNNLEAINLLTKEINLNSGNHLAFALKGQIGIDSEVYENAIENFFYAIKLDKSNKEYLNSFGIANAKYGYNLGGDTTSFSTAYNAYSEAIEIDDKYYPAYKNKALLIYNYLFSTKISQRIIGKENVYEALKLINKTIEINPVFASAYRLRGEIKNKLNDSWAALADIDKAIELDNSDYENYFFRGELKCFGLKDYSNSIHDLNMAFDLAIKNNAKADIVAMRSIVNSLSGSKAKACEDARKAYDLGKSQFYLELLNRLCK